MSDMSYVNSALRFTTQETLQPNTFHAVVTPETAVSLEFTFKGFVYKKSCEFPYFN